MIDVDMRFEWIDEMVNARNLISGRDHDGTSTATTVPDPFSRLGSLGVWYDHLTRR